MIGGFETTFGLIYITAVNSIKKGQLTQLTAPLQVALD
jgi:hypothetical protein